MTSYDHSGNDPRGPGGGFDEHTGELLAAYLSGDLDDVNARSLERRLERDRRLQAQLDSIHDAVLRLRRIDRVEVPAGLEARIRERVASEGSGAAASGRATDTVHLGTRRRAAARGTSLPWWRRPVAAVAALVFLGVVALSSFALIDTSGGGDASSVAGGDAAIMAEQGAQQGFGGDGGGEADSADRAAQESTGEESTGAESTGEGSTGGAAPPDAASDDEAGEMQAFNSDAATAPAVVVLPAEHLDSAAARRRYLEMLRSQFDAGRPPSPEEGARGLGDEQRAALRDVGADPACSEILVPAGQSAVEILTVEGDPPAVGAVTAADDGALTLTIVDPASCEVRAEETLPAP